ncbi:TPA: DUF1302 domain-containing protein [Pseudomonas aeruginosa]|nr:DUF1302 domain-containing protein [Pseudomonas aeruginosa]HCE9552469.1 DUF1302 domain-containing protein [Pseudomonas aeruginosa]
MKVPSVLSMKAYPGKPGSGWPLKLAIAMASSFISSTHAIAVELSPENSDVTINLDTTVSYGRIWRVQGQEHNNDNMNQNDGNRNFNTGLTSEVFKITSDAAISYQNYGAFLRGTAFYDTQIMDKRTDFGDNNFPRQPSGNYPRNSSFSKETREEAGSDVELLDAYIYGNWDVGDRALSARVGRQVFNWGEGLFYRGGINTTNPMNVAKLRLPGSEIKEVLIPVEAFSLSFDLSENLSAEAFYQWNWRESAFDPMGTFFAESDLFVPGSRTAYTNSASLASPAFQGVYNTLSSMGVAGLQGTEYLDRDGNFKVASIGRDINARDDGQFGVSFRYLAEQLNATEFGFYFVNYHAKEPVIASSIGESNLDMDALAGIATGGAFTSYQTLAAAAAATGNTSLVQAAGLIRGASVVELGNLNLAQREFPEDIRMYGMSFNTSLADASVFGEISYRPNLPIGKAALNDTVADAFAQTPQIFAGQTANIGGTQSGPNSTLHNYERVEAFNASLGTIYNFGPGLTFDSIIGTAEVAAEMIRGSSLKYTAYDGSTRYFAGRANKEYAAGFGRDEQIDRNAYGATVLFMGTWNDIYAGVNLSPYVIYKDDFKGNSYASGNFIEGRKAYTLGMKASYLSSFEVELQYTNFYGAGQSNVSRDRDNVGLNVKYSF